MSRIKSYFLFVLGVTSTLVLPATFLIFRLVFIQTMKKFPAKGWDVNFNENNGDV